MNTSSTVKYYRWVTLKKQRKIKEHPQKYRRIPDIYSKTMFRCQSSECLPQKLINNISHLAYKQVIVKALFLWIAFMLLLYYIL